MRLSAAQALMATTDRIPYRGLRNRLVLRVLALFRRLLIRLGDPLVECRVGSAAILLPTSHDLPLIRKVHPDYGTNVARVARLTAAKYPDLLVVDVGANVGDTAAFVRELVDVPVLCVEGDESFFSILESNLSRIGDRIVAEPYYVDANEGIVAAQPELSRGTGRLVEDATGPGVATVRLSTLVERHASLGRPKLIKIDTDGFDGRIIRAELPLLERLAPVLFFEYDPFYLAAAGDPGSDLFALLASVGYGHAIFYEGVGEYLISVSLEDAVALSDLDAFYRGRGGHRYADVCAFHREDEELWRLLRESELEYFARRRSG